MSLCETTDLGMRLSAVSVDFKKYPDIVSLPEGGLSALMLIQSPKLKGCAMCILWDTDVTLEGEIRPKVELLMKMPDEAMRMDSNDTVGNAPKYFQNLLHAVGAETAIECIIKTVLV
ncbi:hypothetical protein ACEWY4_013783 [Coilia grayii]|uniref:Uncharacterized protein n=1 Tax=Coilia grayii TaxID=363190 RepID=A0ABD1JXC8_9TELE